MSKAVETGLVHYDTAKKSLEKCRTVDEALKIRDSAKALRIYAQISKDRALEIDAVEIRARAERKLGELMAAQREAGLLKRGRPTKNAQSMRLNLEDVGIDTWLADRARKLAALDDREFKKDIAEWREAAEASGTPSFLQVIKKVEKTQRIKTKAKQRKVSTEKAKEAIAKAAQKKLEKVCELRVCSCAELLASGIRPAAVITDPPYPRKFLPVFAELAEGCKIAKVPLVAVMSGQSYLPDVMEMLCQHLTYRWTMAYLTPGGEVQQWQAQVNTGWKPVIVFGKAQEWFGDVVRSDANDKTYHHWGQSESGMRDLVSRLTKPGALVCDPFLGGGATAAACLQTGRRFIGCDVDAKAVATTRARLEELVECL